MRPVTKEAASGALPTSWDRQPHESHKAFAGFSLYRDLGGDRTYQDVAEKLHCSGANVRRWAALWNWYSRACDWDDYEDQKVQEAQIRERMLMAQRHARTGMLMQNIATAEMDKLRESLENSQLGQRGKLSASEIAKFVEIGSRIERSARGEANPEAVAKIELIFDSADDDD